MTYSSTITAQEIEHEHKSIPAQSVATEISVTELVMMTIL